MFNSAIYGMPMPMPVSTDVQTVFGRIGPNIYAQTGDYTAAMVGADPVGEASAVMVAHINGSNPHVQYALKTDLEAYFDAAIAYFDNNINLP